MQKFVKTNTGTSMSTSEEQTTLHPSQVKLVGYLKKKRTKVGGWRKMWFVLQNQLLLSYPSKDDYDKKLVSFKDVLNLVPGTIVRPLGGYRFAIQTTSESVYIFRCDDNRTYLEWITALVDSLAIGSSTVKKKDGFGNAVFKKPLHGSYSCSSLVRSKKNKAVNIPIAHGTARILKRTGLSENDLRAFSSTEYSFHDCNERAHYFCLHENPLLVPSQSNAVTRINRMFCGSASDVELSSTVCAAGLSDTGLIQQTKATTTPTSSGLKGLQCESDGEIGYRSAISRKMHELLNLMKSEDLKVVLDETVDSQVSSYAQSNRSFDCETNLNKERDELLPRNLNEASDIVGNGSIEDHIQRLSLQGSSDFMISGNTNTSADKEKNCLRLSTTLKTETETSSPLLRHGRRNEKTCSSISSGSCTSSEKRNESPYNAGEIEVIEDTGENSKDEPIYAVVDLKNKYEHRARIRHEMEVRRKSHMSYLKGLDEVATDYEEVLDFENDSFFDTTHNSTHRYDEENIYEPINIPESSYGNHKHRNAWWKYISRINIDALFELGRNRRKTPKSADHTSPFANIRQKFGHHRKSIRIRMIKLYTREQPTPDITERTADSDDNKSDQV